jgi:hypothetical protein
VPAPAPKKEAKGKDEPEPSPRVKAALDSVHALPGIPLRAMVYVLEPRANGSTHVLVAAELDAQQLALREQGSERVANLEVGITAVHRDTGHGFIHDDDIAMAVRDGEALGWRGLAREFELTTGVHQARVVVRDLSSGKMGAVTERFEVPFPGELRLSTPILTDRLVPGSDPKARPQPAVAAHRTFRPSGGLYLQYEVFGAARDQKTGQPSVTAGVEIRTPSGRVVREVEPTPITPDSDRRLVRLMGMGLDGLAEGPYVLAITVRDLVADRRIDDVEPFTIASSAP